MQGAFELGLVAILFFGLQIWWVSKVLFNRPRQPKPMGLKKPQLPNSLREARKAIEVIFRKS